nr:hypothetical protein [Tanacetum cinerariifolium]
MINQIQIKDYRNEKIDIRYRREFEVMIDELKGKFNGMSIKINKKKELQQLEQATNLSTYTTEHSRCFNSFFYHDDDYEESTFHLNETISQIPSSIAITPVLPTMEPEDSLIMEGNSVTFSNPLFDSNDDFTSSDDESLSDEDVPEDKVLENIENKDSYDYNLDEPNLLVTPFSDTNEDECFDPGGDIDEIDAFLEIDISADIKEGYYDSERDIIYLENLLTYDTIPSLHS